MDNTIKKSKKVDFLKAIKAIGFPIISIIFAMLVAVIFVCVSTKTGFIDAAVNLFSSIWLGSFGDMSSISETLVFVTPLIFTGLANAIAFKTGLFNIGTEGQFIIGMLAAAIVGLIPGIPSVLHAILIVLAGIIAGGIWAGIAGFLKATRGVSEVVPTIMLNFIAMYVSNIFVMGPLNKTGAASSREIQDSAKLMKLFGPDYRTSIALILAVVIVILVHLLLTKTTIGYELRSVGLSPFAAEYGGISIKKNIILAMVISGAIAGIGGATHVAGINYNATQLSSFPNFGFTGMAAALLAKSNPIGVIFGAIVFGALESSSLTLQMNGIPKDIVYLVQSIIILFIAADSVYKILGNKLKKNKGVKVNG
ncbi:ABC transporter permease [Inconstantimicrobium mannanitabidum]|uniref:ABC transporter permease n=1 Tax=Inconstantimicrobium mannanitabidum TaxID=1604901 RepID=A0ACB5REW9_9CLOT|nr:ABC transporter permease [Clostridium sp. TW13]GKX67722.1 ABC transporter permease [Clostridium sp. TW13]